MSYLATYRTNYTGAMEQGSRAIRTTAPVKHSSVVDGTKPVWMWFDEMVKGIRLSNEQPDLSLNPRYVPHLTTGGGLRKEEKRTTLFTKAMYQPAGIEGNSYVSVLEQGNDLIYKAATHEERPSAQTRPERASDGKVKQGRHIRFTKSTQNMLDIRVGDDVHVKIDTINGCWLEITKAAPDSSIPGMRGMLREQNLPLRSESLCFEYRANYGRAGLFLPVAFLKKGRVKNSDVLPFRVEGKTVIIEGNPLECNVCGQMLSQYKTKMGTANTCSECRPKVDAVQEAAKASGGLREALENTMELQNTLLELIAEVQLKVEKGTSNHENQ